MQTLSMFSFLIHCLFFHEVQSVVPFKFNLTFGEDVLENFIDHFFLYYKVIWLFF